MASSLKFLVVPGRCRIDFREVVMRVLLRDGKTGTFLAVDGTWTAIRKDAFDFKTCPEAVEKAVALKLPNAQILLDFGSASLDMTLPIG